MPKLNNYNGSVALMAGITQKGGGDFAMVEAHAVQTGEDGKRLDEELGILSANIAKNEAAIGEIQPISDEEIIALFASI